MNHSPLRPHRLACRTRRWVSLIVGLVAAGLTWVRAAEPAANGFLEIRNGYFWDPVQQEYFIPRGVAYQTWNPPVGANQSFSQIDYDLREFKKLHANSVRCDFTWGELEIAEGQYDWSKTDYLIAKAGELGLRLFVLIGYQYPPAWVPREYRAVNDRYTTTNDPAQVESEALSDVINYEHPEARRLYANHIAAVTGRYRDNTAIGGWILGNEYAYYDLWEDPVRYPVRRFLGYDPISVDKFRAYLRRIYQGDLALLNGRWGTAHTDFATIEMPRPYPVDRVSPPYHDLIQWRKESIGDYVAVGAVAAAKADPNHLRTYSMVGAIYSNYDANHTCEDARTIVARCRVAAAPLQFWSVNNYAWPSLGSELRSADFGVAKYQSEVGLPVLVSETGFTSTEVIWSDELAGERQAGALAGTMWEQLMAGAAGVHFFHWSDRNQYTPEYFYREKGFGIVGENRKRKGPVYDNIVRMFRQMENIRFDRLFGGSTNPPADIQFLWSINSDMVWPRANQENCMIWGVLKRLGYQPEIIFDEEFARGDFRRVKALLLSRAYQLSPQQLDQLAGEVLPAGVHIHAQTDLPGQFDAYHRENPNWAATMDALFGLDVRAATPGLDGCVTNYNGGTLTVLGKTTLGLITPGYRRDFQTWKIWHDTRVSSGRAILNHTGLNGSRPESPALVVKDFGPGKARTAVQTFAVGDIGALSSESSAKLALYRRRVHHPRLPVVCRRRTVAFPPERKHQHGDGHRGRARDPERTTSGGSVGGRHSGRPVVEHGAGDGSWRWLRAALRVHRPSGRSG